MPVNNNNNSQQKKKKKKGRAPAHQNTFAFTHNPKSKKTARILDMPIKHVCQRCQDKLEWRKKYRKYKPRTQPGSCNICQQKRVVLAAYHTICEKCTLSRKAHTNVCNHLGIDDVVFDTDNTSSTAAAAAADYYGSNGNNKDHPADDQKEEQSQQQQPPPPP